METITVLFVGALPDGTAALRLDREARAVQQALHALGGSVPFRLETCWAATFADLQTALLGFRPEIVHFAGHGAPGALLLQDELGRKAPAPAPALSRLFAGAGQGVRLVVLNACDSVGSAHAVAPHVGCAVGTTEPIGDAGAVAFAAAFYQALGAGRSVAEAFGLGQAALEARGFAGGEDFELLAGRCAPTSVRFGVPEAVRLGLDSGKLRVPRHSSPAHLLLAQHQVVGFIGRAGVCADLDAWAAGSGVSVRLVHGEGGAGKTRLAAQWVASRSGPAGFLAGEVTAARRAALLEAAEADVVIDHAEGRPELATLLADLARRWSDGAPGRLRVLLLARGAGDWWQHLLGDEAIGALLADGPPPLELPSMREAERHEHFSAAASAFQARLGWPALPALPDLSDPRFGRPLYLHLAAFLAGEGQAVKADQVLGAFLDHEARCWLARGGFAGREASDGARAWRRTIEGALAALTLLGGAVDLDHLAQVLEGLGHSTENRIQIEGLLADLYGSSAQVAGPLQPDLLGEALVLRVLRDHRYQPRWLERATQGAALPALTHAFTVLGRAEDLDAATANAAERHLLAAQPARAFPAAFQALVALQAQTAYARLGQELARGLEVHGTPALAADLAARLPALADTVQLREVAAWVHETLAATVEDPEARAEHLLNLGRRLADLGRDEAALTATTEAVATYRGLTEPGTIRVNLAHGLNNLGNMLAALGRFEAARVATEEAVASYRQLTAAMPEVAAPWLAVGLSNLSERLVAQGAQAEALAAAEEAVEIHRRRAEEASPDLANRLLILGARRADCEQWSGALAACGEAVEIYRQLARTRPDAWLPDLALALGNRCCELARQGHADAAVADGTEAVAIFRPLADARPAAFGFRLATALTNLGLAQGGTGRWEAAHRTIGEAVELLRGLAADQPAVWAPKLAVSLGALGQAAARLDQPDAAGAAFAEGVMHLWPHFEQEPFALAPLMGQLLAEACALAGDPPPEVLAEYVEAYQRLTGPTLD